MIEQIELNVKLCNVFPHVGCYNKNNHSQHYNKSRKKDHWMKKTIVIAGLGRVTYEESFWTGKNKVYVNDVLATKLNKKTFEYYPDPKSNETDTINLQGNFLTGVAFNIQNASYQVIEKLKWYEILIAVLTFAFTIVWGNSIALAAIFPIVGGAIGGAIAGLCALSGLVVCKSLPKAWQKVLVLMGFFVLNVLLGYIAGKSFLV